jgi:hypothetical protein
MTVKKQLLIILMVTIVLATVFLVGCSENVINASNPSSAASTAIITRKVTPIPTPVATSMPPVNEFITMPTAREFTSIYGRINPNDAIVTPFTKSVNGRGHVTFTGVTRTDNSNVDKTNIFELCNNKANAQQTYQQLVSQASQSGYHFDPRDLNAIQDRTSMMGHILAPSSQKLVQSIIISWDSPNDYGIGYYVETTKTLAPNT